MFAWERATGTPNVLSGSDVVFDAPMVADPGTAVRLRDQHRLARAGRRGGRPASRWTRRCARNVTGRSGWCTPRSRSARGPTAARSSRSTSGPPTVGGRPSEIELDQHARVLVAGGHGLYSTPRDYLTFQRMLLGDGTSPDGVTILAPETVQAAFSNQIGDLDFPRADPHGGPGLGVRARGRPGLQVGARSAAQHRRSVRPPPGGQRRVGGIVQHPLLGRPHIRNHRRHLQSDAAVHRAGGAALYAEFETALYASL